MRKIAAVLASLTLAAPAFAGGPTTALQEPVVTPSYSPALPAALDWSGFYVGAQLGYGDVNSSDATLDGNGTLGGVHAGYRWDFGSFVAGAELDYDSASIDLGVGTDTLDDVTRLKLSGGAKFGNALIYGTTGIARAGATVGGNELRDTGYFLGAGVDMALTERWVVGAELLKHQFNDFDGSTVDLDATTLKARVSLRF
jgi:outer membrane immunogenic protein